MVMIVDNRINERLIENIKSGDESAFAILYDVYFSFLCVQASALVQNTEDAKDIVNDLFVNIWNNRSRLNFPIHPYIMTALKNNCLSRIRNDKSKLQMMESYKTIMDFRIERIHNMESMEFVEIIDSVNIVKKTAQFLPERCRVIFEMYFYFGYNSTEIAEYLGLSPNTIRVQLKIALEKLKKEISPLVLFLIFSTF
jgi:RNA polymerase sigma-70 factor (family 1)